MFEINPDRDIYAAALLDSRGSIAISATCKTNRDGSLRVDHFLRVTVRCREEELLNYLYTRYGNRGKISGGCWTLYTVEAGKFLEMVLPHLQLRGKEAVIGIEFANLVQATTDALKYVKLADKGSRMAERERLREAGLKRREILMERLKNLQC